MIEAPIEGVAGEVINLATGIDISVEEIADQVLDCARQAAVAQASTSPSGPGQVDRHIGSTDKALALTGWRARTSFDEGLARTVAWYRENEAWWKGLLRTGARVSSS